MAQLLQCEGQGRKVLGRQAAAAWLPLLRSWRAADAHAGAGAGDVLCQLSGWF